MHFKHQRETGVRPSLRSYGAETVGHGSGMPRCFHQAGRKLELATRIFLNGTKQFRPS